MGHVLYKPEDFTKEEIYRENIIAVAVVYHEMKICKLCGKIEDELVLVCQGRARDIMDSINGVGIQFDMSQIQFHPKLHPRFSRITLYGTRSGRFSCKSTNIREVEKQ
jgi:hypothetical protein